MKAGSRLAVIFVAAFSTGTIAAESIRGPIQGTVTGVVDGDTIEFVARVWLGLELTTHVRVRGIDAPEVNGKCPAERAKAAEATSRLAELTASGITITNVSDDKYFGRVVADVTTLSGADVGRAMVAEGLARPYDGGTRQPWCGMALAGP